MLDIKFGEHSFDFERERPCIWFQMTFVSQHNLNVYNNFSQVAIT